MVAGRPLGPTRFTNEKRVTLIITEDTAHLGNNSYLKVKVKWIYIVPSRETSKVLGHGSHSVICKLQHACLYLVSVHQMALPLTGDSIRLIAAYYSSIDFKRMKG